MSSPDLQPDSVPAHPLRDTLLTLVGLLGFAVLTLIFTLSRPSLPTQRETEGQVRAGIGESVKAKEGDLLAESVAADGKVERIGVEKAVELTAPAVLTRPAVVVDDPAAVVPGTPTANAQAAAPAPATEGEAAPAAEGEEAPATEATPAAEGEAAPAATPATASIEVEPEVAALDGQGLYALHCQTCHMDQGQGMPDYARPPLAGSTWLLEGPEVLGRIVLHGLTGPITVNGEEFDGGLMLPLAAQMNDAEIAAVLNFVRSSWAPAPAPAVRAADIAAVRLATADRDPSLSWTVAELQPFLSTVAN